MGYHYTKTMRVVGLGIEPRYSGLQPDAVPLSYPTVWMTLMFAIHYSVMVAVLLSMGVRRDPGAGDSATNLSACLTV